MYCICKLGCSPRISYTLQGGFIGMKRARASGLDGYFCGLSSWEFICKLSLCMDLHWISFCTTPLVRPLRRVAGLIRNTFHGVVCHSDSTGKQTALLPIEGGTKIYSLYHLPSSRSRYCHLSHHPLGRTLRQKTPLRNCHIFDIYKKNVAFMHPMQNEWYRHAQKSALNAILLWTGSLNYRFILKVFTTNELF